MYCQLEVLLHCLPPSIRRILDNLPEALDETYERILRTIDKQKRDYAYRLFRCLVVSKRPLRVEELAELLTIQPDVGTNPTFKIGWRPEDPENFVLSVGSPLVTIETFKGKKIVQFSHFSVREYLVSERIRVAYSENVSHFHVFSRSAHAFLARACLGVLLQLHNLVERDKIRNFPLALYAAKHWVDHAQFEDVSSDIRHGMESLFDKNKPHFAAWLRLYDIDHPSPFLEAAVLPSSSHAVPLYYAALCGFRDITELLADAHPQEVNARGGKRMTPLHAAVDNGHLGVAMLLLERGADIESPDSQSQTALHTASYRGYRELAALLIDHGADTNHPDVRGRTPLYLASLRGHDDTVRLLLGHGADANRPDSDAMTPLHLATREGHNKVVRLLMDHETDVNYPDKHGRTPLHLASERGHDNIVRLLFDRGAGGNLPDVRGRIPLHYASLRGQNSTIQLLLDYGADAFHRDNRGRTPLHYAALRGHNDAIRLLLYRGADANHPDSDSTTPLHLASREGHNDTVELLLDNGAVPNHPDNSG